MHNYNHYFSGQPLHPLGSVTSLQLPPGCSLQERHRSPHLGGEGGRRPCPCLSCRGRKGRGGSDEGHLPLPRDGNEPHAKARVELSRVIIATGCERLGRKELFGSLCPLIDCEERKEGCIKKSKSPAPWVTPSSPPRVLRGGSRLELGL